MEERNLRQRKHKRVPVNLHVGIVFNGDLHFAQAVSISEGGMLIKTPLKVRLADHIKIQMLLGNENVSADGEVIYVLPGEDEQGAGIRFRKVAARDLDLIRAFVQQINLQAA